MNIQQQLNQLRMQQYKIVDVIDLDHCLTLNYAQAQAWLDKEFARLYKKEFLPNERIVFTQKSGDHYVKDANGPGLILRNLQLIANKRDISNFFIVLLSNNPNLEKELELIKSISTDPVPITGIYCPDGEFNHNLIEEKAEKNIYEYGSTNPLKVNLTDLTEKEQFLLTESKVFCMYPWTHLHAWPTGQAFPCCMADSVGQVGDCRSKSLKEIWNDQPMMDLRKNMLNEQPSPGCERCYEQEKAGFFSGRRSANKHQGHLIDRVAETEPTGYLERFEMNFWDIRFSNLCNLSCRSCGHIFSSSWFQDQARLAGPEWAQQNRVLNFAGKDKKDMWHQLIPHLDYVEQIYFAGGEPLLMEEHYNILDELELRGRFDVRLIYNTNFTEIRLKDRTVFDYWKRFKSVAVGASLDAMGSRAEYIRKGTKWDQVERNREQMMETCPDVDFYISPTLSIMNALHLPDFHRAWVEKGYIKPQDLNVNLLQDPPHYRIDIAPEKYKQMIEAKYQEHLAWLEPLDHLKRASTGFASAITFMNATDNAALLPKFWAKTRELDQIRKERILDVIPELRGLE